MLCATAVRDGEAALSGMMVLLEKHVHLQKEVAASMWVSKLWFGGRGVRRTGCEGDGAEREEEEGDEGEKY